MAAGRQGGLGPDHGWLAYPDDQFWKDAGRSALRGSTFSPQRGPDELWGVLILIYRYRDIKTDRIQGHFVPTSYWFPCAHRIFSLPQFCMYVCSKKPQPFALFIIQIMQLGALLVLKYASIFTHVYIEGRLQENPIRVNHFVFAATCCNRFTRTPIFDGSKN